MVEHDLAKVGVASSNLVSRSIFSLFITLPLCAATPQTLYIEKTYCITHETLNASFFGYKGSNDSVVVTIPKERAHYSVPTQQILTALGDKNVTVIDSTQGVVNFKRHCHLMGKADVLEAALMKKFQELSPLIVFEGSPIISIKSPLPNDFERYVFDSISLSENMLRKANGSFIGTFMAEGKRKKLYFYYEVKAKLPAFKAKRNLQSGKILQTDDFEAVLIELDALPTKPILGEMPSSLIIKNYVKEGQILSDYFFDAKKDLMKKESIKAFFHDENLVIELEVTLQEDANIGEVVKVKTEQGKILNAKILSLHEAMILE